VEAERLVELDYALDEGRHVDLGLSLQEAIDAPEFHTDHLIASFYPRGFVPKSLALESRFGSRTVADLQRRGHDVTRIVIPRSSRAEPARGLDLPDAPLLARIDVAFLALHGRMGEDGCIQGMLEIAGIPYTGSSVLASALAMDKLKGKELFLLHNVPTPPYYAVSIDDDIADVESIHRHFGFPVVPDVMKLVSTRPDFLRIFFESYKAMFGGGHLPRQVKEMIATVVSKTNSCSY
jgi:hypothetical protein